MQPGEKAVDDGFGNQFDVVEPRQDLGIEESLFGHSIACRQTTREAPLIYRGRARLQAQPDFDPRAFLLLRLGPCFDHLPQYLVNGDAVGFGVKNWSAGDVA